MHGRVVSVVLVVVTVAALSEACDQGSGASPPAGPDASGPPAPAVKPPSARPIVAVFTQPTFSTTYEVTVGNPDRDEITFTWSGPNCGNSDFQPKTPCADAECKSAMTWLHPHPPCELSPTHDEATIFVRADGKKSGKGAVCAYRGAETGTGEPCGLAGFGDSTVGVVQRNAADLYFRASNNDCSQIDLIQVMSIRQKAPPGAIVVPHNAGIEDSLTPVPEAADDQGGYVVDKHMMAPGSTGNSPYYGAEKPGTPTTPAELFDRPGNTAKGHVAYFEVCAFCSAKDGDAAHGKYLDCITWQYDKDEGAAKVTEPQPTEKPTPGFRGAVDKWNANHGFTMPGPK